MDHSSWKIGENDLFMTERPHAVDSPWFVMRKIGHGLWTIDYGLAEPKTVSTQLFPQFSSCSDVHKEG
jgi:hypothetical protein